MSDANKKDIVDDVDDTDDKRRKSAHVKSDHVDVDDASSAVFEDSLDTLLFEMGHIVKNSTLGFNLKTALCFTYLAQDRVQRCFRSLESAVAKLKAAFRVLDNTRYADCGCTTGLQ